MSRLQLERTSTLEENFMFGSPPLLKGFAYNTCRSQESSFSNGSSHQSFLSKSIQQYDETEALKEEIKNLVLSEERKMNFHQRKRIDLNEQRSKDGSLSFIKRKDLRTLKCLLSKERYRQVVMKFGCFDDEGREILDSVHKTMTCAGVTNMKCVLCSKQSEVYQNFPVVDGTLFLSPIQISKTSVKFHETTPSIRFMSFVCVGCMEGQNRNVSCKSCGNLWNGSFFQIGTLYTYNILSALPCCSKRVSCSSCEKPVVNVTNGELESLFFSHFSTKTFCPHCQKEDYHFIKSLAYSLNSIVPCK